MIFDVAPILGWLHWATGLAYTHAPIVAIASLVFVLVPLLAIVGYLLARPAAPGVDPVVDMERREMDVLREASARRVRIELPGGKGARTIRHRPLRIGRQPDNDIHLLDKTVHGYHAVVARTADGLSVIDDVSGPSGNGIKVNGKALRHAVLQPGDVIELGKARLRVVAGPDIFQDAFDETRETSTREQAA